MSRFKLYIEYEGTRYSGWQKQKNAKTIQGILLNITRDIFNDSKVDLQGSGRTDSGVHALCQVAHLDVNTMLAPEIIKLKINDMLPSDINILEVEKANKNFHARHNAVSRSYIYQISDRRIAFGKNFVWWIKDKLNFSEMNLAAQEFIGMHDFFSFTEKDSEEKSTKVMIDDVQLKKEDNLILIRIIGSHFLWKMVRRMVGILVEIGRGKMTIADLRIFLITKTKGVAKYTAPPSGLFLENVYYKGEKIKDDFEPPVKIMSTFYLQE
jgi:tRNA pseudouridine38-40 synthase